MCRSINSKSSTETQNQVQSRLLLDVVVGQRAPVLELLTGENETLLIGRNSLLVLNFGLHILDRVGSLDIQGDSFASQSLDKNLHTTTQAQNQVQSRLLLDVVVRQCTPVLE